MSTFQNAEKNRDMAQVSETGRIETTDAYKDMKRKYSGLLIGFSMSQILIGFLFVVINGVSLGKSSIAVYESNMNIYYGFFIGTTFIVTGAIGSAAAKEMKKGLAVSFNILCIISASLCFYVVCVSIISLSAKDVDCFRYYLLTGDAGCASQTDEKVGMKAVFLFLALMEVGLAIGSSVVCCTIGACCCPCDCGCCCPTKYQMLDNSEIDGLQLGQQQYVTQLHPSQLVPQNDPKQATASSNFQ